MSENNEKTANRIYRDSTFRLLFNDEKNALELYNALNNTHFEPDSDIVLRTIENPLWLDIRNDVSFTLKDRFVVFFEHQSTRCPNMPIRMAEYVGRTFENIAGKNVFKEHLYKIPTPEFYVFYNGRKDIPPQRTYRLSDNFSSKPSENSMELVVKVIDIRYNKDSEILEKCRVLNEYSRFVYLIETNLKNMPLEDAISKAVLQCHKEGILTDFLEKYGLEALSMAYRIVTQEEYGDLREQDGIEYGIEIGEKRGIEIGEQRGIELGEQRGEKRGIDIGRNEIITAIQRLKKGSTPQELLADGYAQELIDAALTCL